MARLFIVAGPSGVGKGTILKEFLARNEKVKYSVSTTTRKPREGEVCGRDYFFVDEDTFLKMTSKNEFLEWAQYSKNYYGTTVKFVEDTIKAGYDVVLEIELQGALQVMEKVQDCVSVFIAPPSLLELERRLRDRATEDEDTILRRLDVANTELAHKEKFSYVIENDKLEDAVLKLQEIYERTSVCA